jgi:hypothetical protein
VTGKNKDEREEERTPPNPSPTVDLPAMQRDYRVALGFAADATDEQVRAELTSLRERAAFGDEARTELIEDALKQGKRAVGESFAEETYRSLLTGQKDIKVIQQMRDDWKASGDKLFQPGRSTKDEGEPAPKESDNAQERDEIPAHHYRV